MIFCVGCSVDHTGLLPTVPGDRYRVACEFEYSYRLDTSYGMLPTRSSTQVCSNGPLDRPGVWTACTTLGFSLQGDPAGLFDEITSINITRSYEPEPLPEPCTIVSTVRPGGIGEVLNELTPVGSSADAGLFSDSRGALLEDISTATLKGAVSRANIIVGAKFLSWAQNS